jgi:hypothetical protein
MYFAGSFCAPAENGTNKSEHNRRVEDRGMSTSRIQEAEEVCSLISKCGSRSQRRWVATLHCGRQYCDGGWRQNAKWCYLHSGLASVVCRGFRSSTLRRADEESCAPPFARDTLL